MKTKLDQLSLSKKILLVLAFFCINALVVGVIYLVTRPFDSKPAATTYKLDYQKIMQMALQNFEDAESALIYQDYEKAEKLLKKSERYARQITPEETLYQDARSLIEQIKKQQDTVEKAIKEQQKAEEEAKKALTN